MSSDPNHAVDITTKTDPTSQSNPTQVEVTHAEIVWNVDFTSHLITGSITYTCTLLTTRTVIFDTKEMDIKKVVQIDGSNETELKYDLGTKHDVLGTPLNIHVGDSVQMNTPITLRIHYTTTSTCSATQWLTTEQTKDKKHPFLFTQCQAIHARTLIPVQDTPGQKITYKASVTVPAPLTALMSALPVSNEKNGDLITYHFNQPIPIPSYLLALAVGFLESRKIGPRSHVWSEPSMVDACAYEFAQTEKFLIEAEKLVGPYVWGQYDLLVLPPSFPYGGMENPCMTFVTPTLLAGDRSLESVVAHEAAHSWMGNLVTNHTWRDFWLNEGFTVFLERKIVAALYGDAEAGLHAQGGWVHLQESVDHFGKDHGYTHLVPDLSGGIDPDDVFSSVPYEKGFNLLWYLQSLITTPLMNKYLRAHVDRYAQKTCTTYEFQQFFITFAKENGVKDEILSSIPWNTWFFTAGMPANKPTFDQSLIGTAHQLAEKLVAQNGIVDGKEGDIAGWNANQVLILLDQLIDLQSRKYKTADDVVRAFFITTLEAIDAKYKFSTSQNAEIKMRWYTLAIRAEITSIHPRVIEFLSSVGRMKYVRPLYRDLYASRTGRDLAVSTFKQHYKSYHSVAAKMVAKDLGVTL